MPSAAAGVVLAVMAVVWTALGMPSTDLLGFLLGIRDITAG